MRNTVDHPSHIREKEGSMRLIPTIIPKVEPRAPSPGTADNEVYVPGSTLYAGCTQGGYSRVYTPGKHTYQGIPGYIHQGIPLRTLLYTQVFPQDPTVHPGYTLPAQCWVYTTCSMLGIHLLLHAGYTPPYCTMPVYTSPYCTMPGM